MMQRLTFFRVFIQVYLNCVHAYCSFVGLLSIGRPAVEWKSYEIFLNNDSVKQTNKQTNEGIDSRNRSGWRCE